VDPKAFVERIRPYRTIPVVALDSVDQALPLADALIAGGLPIVEVTFRTEAAADVIRTLKEKRPQLLVGAGTVLSEANVRAAVDAGAEFAVAPGLNPTVVRAAQDAGLLFIPGIATPTDIEGALALGCRILKFFPAEALGGTAMLAAISAPYAHLGLQFLPTGGVNAGNLTSYLNLPAVLGAGGTWIAKKEELVAGKMDLIVRRCREVADIVAMQGN
jgi:2-dehydro-3-deoxyphosphogluconate aldolase/(4S)-4-hydroxy-2-oxoglutarate aldolase